MSKKKTTAIAKKESADLAPSQGYGDDAGGGFEDQDSSHIQIAWLHAVQSNSEVVAEGKAQAGQLWNTVTEEASDTVDIVPSFVERAYDEWIPVDEGGGFVATHLPGSQVVKDAQARSTQFGKLKVPREGGGDNDLVETFKMFAGVVEDGEPAGMVVIPFSSTKIKEYRRFNTKMRAFQLKLEDGSKQTPPLFAHRVTVGTHLNSRDRQKWYTYTLKPTLGTLRESVIRPDDTENLHLLVAGRDVAKMVKEGKAKVSYDSETTAKPAEDDFDKF